MAKEEKQARVIYKKSEELSKTGFALHSAAEIIAGEMKKLHPEPAYRVRTRLRNRTNTWDVVVKVRTEVKEEKKLISKEISDAKDQAFVANHALTGQ